MSYDESVVPHHLISYSTVSTTGSALKILIRDRAPLYIAVHFFKWHPGTPEGRGQTCHVGGGDTLLFSQPP